MEDFDFIGLRTVMDASFSDTNFDSIGTKNCRLIINFQISEGFMCDMSDSF